MKNLVINFCNRSFKILLFTLILLSFVSCKKEECYECDDNTGLYLNIFCDMEDGEMEDWESQGVGYNCRRIK